MLIAKHIHLTFIGLSFLGFVLRGIWMMMDSPLLQAKLTKILPHVIDTVLLVSAIVLAVQLRFLPTEQPWLMAKIIALLGYIGLGMVAIKPNKPKPVRIGAWVAAIIVFGYICTAALSKSALGYFAYV